MTASRSDTLLPKLSGPLLPPGECRYCEDADGRRWVDAFRGFLCLACVAKHEQEERAYRNLPGLESRDERADWLEDWERQSRGR